MIYHIAKNRNQWACGDPKGYKWWQRAHDLAVATLTLFALADTVLYIYASVLLWGQIDVSSINPKVLDAANSYGQVHITYTALYLAVTIEIPVWAICIAWKAWKQNLTSRVSHHQWCQAKDARATRTKVQNRNLRDIPDYHLHRRPDLTIPHSPFRNYARFCSPLHLRIPHRS